MVLLNENRLLYNKEKVSGAGMVYKQITGNGIFKDSLKTLGKYALFGLKNLWKNASKPKAIMLAKEGVDLGKDLLKENKGNIQKIVSKQSQNILKKLMNKERVDKQDISNIKTDLNDLAKK
jgi:3-oxoacyl-[acyl-carrier-protein] synthase III